MKRQSISDAPMGATETQSLLERVTDALWPLAEWDGERRNAVEAARAAIEAMREPPLEVLSAGTTVAHQSGDFAMGWRTVFDAALQDTSEGKEIPG